MEDFQNYCGRNGHTSGYTLMQLLRLVKYVCVLLQYIPWYEVCNCKTTVKFNISFTYYELLSATVPNDVEQEQMSGLSNK